MEENVKKALEFLKEQIIQEITAQGHVATGNLVSNVEVIVEDLGTKIVGRILLPQYAIYLDKGVSAARIPFGGSTGKGGTSKYITALINWAKIKRPGLSDKEAKGFAFAIAHKAKREGHPTSGSYSYTQNGRRKEWSRYAIDNNLSRVEEILDLDNLMIAKIENLISGLSKFSA